MLNEVKENFQKDVKELNDLKYKITKNNDIDQGQKSKIRI
jgi:hypothetical protein